MPHLLLQHLSGREWPLVLGDSVWGPAPTKPLQTKETTMKTALPVIASLILATVAHAHTPQLKPASVAPYSAFSGGSVQGGLNNIATNSAGIAISITIGSCVLEIAEDDQSHEFTASLRGMKDQQVTAAYCQTPSGPKVFDGFTESE